MKTMMFSIYDNKLEGFMRPFFLQTRAVAVRAIIDLAQDAKDPVSQHPADYILYELGTFEDHTAEIMQVTPPVRLGLVSELITNYDVDSIVPKESHGEATVSDEAPVQRRTARGNSPKSV